MPPVARSGDSISHDNVNSTGILVATILTNVTINILPIIKIGDVTVCSHSSHSGEPIFPFPTTVTTGSPITKAQGIPVARIGDSMSCGATIMTGSPNVNIN